VRVFEGSGGLVESVSESSVNNKWSAATIPHLDSPIRYAAQAVPSRPPQGTLVSVVRRGIATVKLGLE